MKADWSKSKDLVDLASRLIIEFEGFSATPYKCPAGVWTIGYGTTENITESTPPITRQEAIKLLEKEIKLCIAAVERFVVVELNISQMAALTSFVYNVGASNFRKSTALSFINQMRFDNAMERLKLWNKARNKDNELVVLQGLVRRREAEADLFLTPVDN